MSNFLGVIKDKINRLSPVVRKSEAVRRGLVFQETCAKQYEDYLQKDNIDQLEKREDGSLYCKIAGKEHPVIAEQYPARLMSDRDEHCQITIYEGVVEDESGKPTFIKFKQNVMLESNDVLYTGFVKEDDHFERIDYTRVSKKHFNLINNIISCIDIRNCALLQDKGYKSSERIQTQLENLKTFLRAQNYII